MEIMPRHTSLRRAASFLAALFTLGFPTWSQSLTVILTGQSMIRSDIRTSAPSAVPIIASLLRDGDVIFTNFEGTVAEAGQPNDNVPFQGPGFLAPPQALDALKALGFNLIALSNNHSADLKIPGIQNTLRAVTRLSLAHAGIGNTVEEAASPGYLRTSKGTVALVAMASGLIAAGGSATSTRPGVDELRVETGNKPNDEDSKRILQSIQNAARQANLVVVYQHNHVFERPFGTIFREELPERLAPPEWIKRWTHAEIDAGADIVVMHGAPLLHGIEIYHDRPIFYDLGNFIFNVPPTNWAIQEPLTWESVVASVEFSGRQLQSVRLRPIVMNFLGQGQPDAQDPHANNLYLQTRGLPQLATGEQANYILERVAEYSRPFGTMVDIKSGSAEIHPKRRSN